ncbi:T9SS type A sorting domain-containing protein [uncultured Psychroserpens sp.]|uniref:T9SS type A sorting domain-containing protein n=1 Tax=uncultured Psychroserpens sp. TaxID=255436 RepID=UPI00261F24B5|nr:T9SS type A sorting domain-containing protein [uncultured Psychroserpens sp.]
MKYLYLPVLFLLCVFNSQAQEELNGDWVMESIFNYDVLLENPTYSINLKFCSEANMMYLDGFCGSVNGIPYLASLTDNSFDITGDFWNPEVCLDDNQGFEIATHNLLDGEIDENKTISYEITQNGNITTLELNYVVIIDDVPTEVTGYFTQQNPSIETNLIDTWYLQHINTDGAQHDNYFGDLFIQFMDNLSPYCTYEYNGNSGCGFFFGDYTAFDNNTISFILLGESASCDGNNVVDYYWSKTRDILSPDGSGTSKSITYAISGEGLDQELTLINANGDFIVYGKEAPTTTIFDKTWYSHSVETIDGIVNVSTDILPTLNLGTGSTILFELFDVNAFGGCNELFGAHNVYWTNENEFRIFVDYQTLEVCDDNTYEPLYFSVLGNNDNGPFSYDLSPDGSTLTLTNTIGEVLVFGEQPITPPVNELQTTWYLTATNVGGLNRYNAQYGDGQPKISFTTNSTSTGLEYTGLSCNDFFGSYIAGDNNTITKLDFSTTLNFCDDDNTDAFSSSYIDDVLGFVNETTLSYQITGTGNNAILQLTNTDNSNYATFNRIQQTPDMLGDWFLHYLVVNSNQIFNPGLSAATINFDTSINNSGLHFDGFAICTGYVGDYYYNPQQTFNIAFFGTTLGDPCDTVEENNFENLYFNSVLSTSEITELNYEITGTGDDMSLVITNLSNGNVAVYGRQVLSIDDNYAQPFQIQLKENPVNNTINLISSQSLLTEHTYELFSITGQLIASGNLNTDQIDISQLKSGLYFLKVFNKAKSSETIKFIKE